jgi:hypothetical protein
MAYFWLNQQDEMQGYSDVEGELYHYRSNVPGHKKLSAGDYFVYYRLREYVIFGAGIIGEIETKEIKSGQETGMLTDYYAHIGAYVDFDPALQVREIKNRISFLKERDGLRGVPQNSIYEISREDYAKILRTADEYTFLQNS